MKTIMSSVRVIMLYCCVVIFSPFAHAQTHTPTSKSPTINSKRLDTFSALPMLFLSDFESEAGNDTMLLCRIGERSYWFVIDTASSYCIMKRSVQQEANLATDVRVRQDVTKLHDSDKPFIVDGKYTLARANLDVGDATFNSVPFIVGDDDLVGAMTLKKDHTVAGIIGVNFLTNSAISFDYDKRELRVIAHGNVTFDELKELGFDTKINSIDLQSFEEESRTLALGVSCNGKILKQIGRAHV